LCQRLLHAGHVVGRYPLRYHLGRHALGVARFFARAGYFFGSGERAYKHLKHGLQAALGQCCVA